MFQSYLDKVLPDKNVQKILAEVFGYALIPTSALKLEKAVFLHGGGANGKSVIFVSFSEIKHIFIGSDFIGSDQNKKIDHYI